MCAVINDTFVLSEFYGDIITTLIGVIIGGFVTLKASSYLHKKELKLNMEITSLNELIPLLREYSLEVVEQAIYIPQLKSVNDYRSPDKDNSVLKELLSVIDINKFVLHEFSKELDQINTKRISIMLSWEKEKKQIYEFAKKYDEYEMEELMKNEEVVRYLDNNCIKYSELKEFITELIKKMNKHYLKSILK